MVNEKLVDVKLLQFQNEEAGSKFQDFYDHLFSLVPNVGKVEYATEIADGLSRCDIFLPKYDMIVFMDGPKHFLEPPDSKYEAMSLDELRDLSHLRMGDSKMTDKICKDAHKRVLRFDYQQHNILYQKGLLRYRQRSD